MDIVQRKYNQLCDIIIDNHSRISLHITLELTSYREYLDDALNQGLTQEQILYDLDEKIRVRWEQIKKEV